MDVTKHLDLTLINGYLEALDISVIKQMLDLYVEQSALYIVEIKHAANSDDINAWQEHCHKMKGSAASAGLKLVHQKLIDLEKTGENSNYKVAQTKALLILNLEGIAEFKQWLLEK